MVRCRPIAGHRRRCSPRPAAIARNDNLAANRTRDNPHHADRQGSWQIFDAACAVVSPTVPKFHCSNGPVSPVCCLSCDAPHVADLESVTEPQLTESGPVCNATGVLLVRTLSN